jgi:hypothetical protein
LPLSGNKPEFLGRPAHSLVTITAEILWLRSVRNIMRLACDILVTKTEVPSVLHADGSIIHIKINLERGPYE